ncbi:MAG: hypothetical protein ACYCXW_09105 [Solirubrobacteraceae bacterium]
MTSRLTTQALANVLIALAVVIVASVIDDLSISPGEYCRDRHPVVSMGRLMIDARHLVTPDAGRSRVLDAFIACSFERWPSSESRSSVRQRAAAVNPSRSSGHKQAPTRIDRGDSLDQLAVAGARERSGDWLIMLA